MRLCQHHSRRVCIGLDAFIRKDLACPLSWSTRVHQEEKPIRPEQACSSVLWATIPSIHCSTFNLSAATTVWKKSLLLFPSRICIQASSSQAMPTHIDYSSESEEEEMTPNKGSHLSCGSNGDEVKLSLCYSYRCAVDSFSGWPSAVVKSKENHSLSQDLIQGQKCFLCSLGIYALQQSGGLLRFCHCLSQPTYQLWQLDCHSELFTVIWPSQAGFIFSTAIQKPI